MAHRLNTLRYALQGTIITNKMISNAFVDMDFAVIEEKVVSHFINKEEKNMLVKNKTVWVDGSGRERDIKEMSDDHIMNCIAMLQKRKNLLNDVEWSFKAIEKAVKKISNSIGMFVDEMLRREELGIIIED